MAISLPHNIVNGVVPDADEVMANLNALLNQANRTLLVGKISGANGTARTTAGTNTALLADSSQTFSVAVPSVLAVAFKSQLVFGARPDSNFAGSIQIELDGSPTVLIASYSQVPAGGPGTNFEHIKSVPLAGVGLLSLTAGSHTVALRANQVVTLATGFQMAITGVQIQTGFWAGIVMPS